MTDIFAYRYSQYPIWKGFAECEQRLLIQAFVIVNEFFPYYSLSKVDNSYKIKWKVLHDQLARELGLDVLSERMPGLWDNWYIICEGFIKAKYIQTYHDPDQYIKERVSFIELAFRFRENEIAELNAKLPQALSNTKLRNKVKYSGGLIVPGNSDEAVTTWNATQNSTFIKQVSELNERFRRAKAPLTYHNGYI